MLLVIDLEQFIPDGIGMLCAVLDHWASQLDECPKILVATHYHELFYNHILKREREELIGFYTMDLIEMAGKELTYLFKLRPGRAVSSYGCHCAALAGLPASVIERGTVCILLMQGRLLASKFATFQPIDDDSTALDQLKRQVETIGPLMQLFVECNLDDAGETKDFLESAQQLAQDF